MIVSEEKVEKAVHYIAETDYEFAEAKTQVERAKFLIERKEAHAFLAADGPVENRKKIAKLDKEVRLAQDAYYDAFLALEKLWAKRKTAALLVDLWRTEESSRRIGK